MEKATEQRLLPLGFPCPPRHTVKCQGVIQYTVVEEGIYLVSSGRLFILTLGMLANTAFLMFGMDFAKCSVPVNSQEESGCKVESREVLGSLASPVLLASIAVCGS